MRVARASAAIAARAAYRARRARASSPGPGARATARETKATPRRPARTPTPAPSAAPSAPGSPWSTWAAVTARRRVDASSAIATRRAVESGPPETATRRCSPARGAPGPASAAASLRTSAGRSGTGPSYTRRAPGALAPGPPAARASGGLGAGLARDLHVDAVGGEPGELLDDACQVGVAGAGADAELEARPLPCPTGIFADRLRHVGSEPAGALDRAAPGGHHAGRDENRLADLPFTPHPHEREHGVDEVAVRAHAREGLLRNREAEVGLEREPDLEQIERVGGQVVDEGHVERELVAVDAETLRDQPAHTRLDEAMLGSRFHARCASHSTRRLKPPGPPPLVHPRV